MIFAVEKIRHSQLWRCF